MDFESATNLLKTEGFSWARFRDFFPFGDISLREGNYQKLVLEILEQLGTPEQKEMLLDLLDTQNCVYLEQVWIQNEQHEDKDDLPFPIEAHFITAQMQINSNIRWDIGLKKKDLRSLMLNLPISERLLDRIMIPSKN